MRNFAMGCIFAVPSGATPTPIPIAILKSVSVDFKQTKKELRGQWKAPIDFAEGPLDIDIKIAAADFRASMLTLLTGSSSAVGSVMPVFGEAKQVPAPSGPYTVTVANAGTFVQDGGVLDLTAGLWMSRAASATGTGIYSGPAAGVYTFNAADASHNLLITYSYTAALVGQTITVPNAVMGPSTAFAVRAYNVYTVNGTSRPMGFDFPAVHFMNLSFGFKSEDWTEYNLEGKVAQDTASTTVFKHYLGE